LVALAVGAVEAQQRKPDSFTLIGALVFAAWCGLSDSASSG
jgi:hypothetical protein